jgi:nitrilase
MNNKDLLTVGLAQITPVWLNKNGTINKIEQYVSKAAAFNLCFRIF